MYYSIGTPTLHRAGLHAPRQDKRYAFMYEDFRIGRSVSGQQEGTR